MSVLTDVVGAATSGPVGGIAGVLAAAKGIIGEFVTDPTAKLAATQHLVDVQAQLQLAQITEQEGNVQAASANILHDGLGGVRKVFGYGFVAMMIWNYAVVPMLHKTPVELPIIFTAAFTTLLLGTSAMNLAGNISALPGDSSVSVLGVKVGNKS
jgi:hypothetical protein